MDFLHQLGITPQLLLTQIVGFLLLMFLLWRFAFGRIFGILDERRDTIQASYDQLDADRAAMEETRRQYEARLAGIEAEAREKIQAAVQEAQVLRGNLIADAQKQAETILTQGRNENERERQKAFLEMRQQIVAIAIAAAGKVVGENLNDARQTKLVDDFIGSVGVGGVTEAGRGVSGNAIGNGGGQGRGMKDIRVAKRYAAALFGVALRDSILDAVAADLDLIGRFVAEVPYLRAVLNQPLVSDTRKNKVITDAFGDRVTASSLNFLKLLVRKRREDLIEECIREFRVLLAEHSGTVDAEAWTAVPMTLDQQQGLVLSLHNLTGKKVRLRADVDAALVGGVVVRIGDTVIDGSVRGKLERLERQLLGLNALGGAA